MKKFIFLLLGAMILMTPLETFAATNSSNAIITPQAYQETVVSYTRQLERKAVLVGDWETLAYVETGYKNIQFTNGYRFEGTYPGYSDTWREGLFYFRYKYVWYSYSTY